jgi:hypothetical protein
MLNEKHPSEILDEKAASYPTTTDGEDLKLSTVIITNEEEKAILKKIDLQYVPS